MHNNQNVAREIEELLAKQRKTKKADLIRCQIMSIIIMFRRCQYCKHRYPYNPSVGIFGHICPRCKRIQTQN